MNIQARLYVFLVVSMVILPPVMCATNEEKEVKELARALIDAIRSETNENKETGQRFLSTCGGELDATEETETFSSPREDNGKYPKLSFCEWTITAPEGQNVHLHFMAFKLEDKVDTYIFGDHCADFVKIYDGPNKHATKLGQYCGSEIPPDMISSGNQLHIRFTSDLTKQEWGFQATFQATGTPSEGNVSDTSEQTCIEEETGNGGVLMPVRSGDYKPDMSCEWHIHAPTGKRIRFSFNFFDLEPSVFFICFDELTIADGSSLISPILLHACGSTVPDDKVSSGPSAYVTFESDDEKQGKGFQLNYEFIDIAETTPETSYHDDNTSTCNGDTTRLTGTSGSIVSPGYSAGAYPDNVRCRWRIDVPKDHVIRLIFEEFDIENQCENDCLKVFDGRSVNSRLLGQFSGSNLPDDVVSTGRFLILEFFSNDKVAKKGFLLTFQAEIKPMGDTPPAPVVLPSECGQGGGNQQSEVNDKRILGGQVSKKGMWPWQVLMYIIFDLNDPHNGGQCGGSLIHEEWVLTAAHCLEYEADEIVVTDGSQLFLFFGESNVENLQSNHGMRQASKVFIHPDRTEFGVAPHDIALLKLNEPVQLSDYVNVVCLPSPNSIPVNTKCAVSGWGKHHHEGNTSIELMHVEQTLISKYECGDTWEVDEEEIERELICAMTRGQLDAACQGDSGGPLVCEQGDRYELAGVVNWGRPCGTGTDIKPTMYARVSSYLNWITSVIGQNS